jgi:hypothetical protein
MNAPRVQRATLSPEHANMQKFLADMQAHPSAWPFLNPVNGEEVLDYYELVKHPMGKCNVPSLCFGSLIHLGRYANHGGEAGEQPVSDDGRVPCRRPTHLRQLPWVQSPWDRVPHLCEGDGQVVQGTYGESDQEGGVIVRVSREGLRLPVDKIVRKRCASASDS